METAACSQYGMVTGRDIEAAMAEIPAEEPVDLMSRRRIEAKVPHNGDTSGMPIPLPTTSVRRLETAHEVTERLAREVVATRDAWANDREFLMGVLDARERTMIYLANTLEALRRNREVVADAASRLDALRASAAVPPPPVVRPAAWANWVPVVVCWLALGGWAIFETWFHR